MIDYTLFLLMNVLGILFTALIIAFKNLPEGDEVSGWQGISFVCAIVALIIWLCLAVISLDIGYVQPYALSQNDTIITGSYDVHFTGTWPLCIVYALISIIPFVLLFYLFPETWRGGKEGL